MVNRPAIKDRRHRMLFIRQSINRVGRKSRAAIKESMTRLEAGVQKISEVEMSDNEQDLKLIRRTFLGAGAASGIAAQLLTGASRAVAKTQSATAADDLISMTLLVNGRRRKIHADPRTTLLDVLREKLDLTGTKKGCDHGQCGACTVHVEDRRVLSCLTLALSVQGRPIKTIEGLAPAGELHPMQQAFIDHDAFQCGYCTPGQIMSAVAIVKEGHAETDDAIREYMSGNLCRCAAYPNIVAAVNDAKAKMAAGSSSRKG